MPQELNLKQSFPRRKGYHEPRYSKAPKQAALSVNDSFVFKASVSRIAKPPKGEITSGCDYFDANELRFLFKFI